MSVINQMLRDLDRQQSRAVSLDGQTLPAVPDTGASWGWKLAALALLAMGIALAFWLRPTPPANTPGPSPAATPAPPRPSPSLATAEPQPEPQPESRPEPGPLAESAAPAPARPAAVPEPGSQEALPPRAAPGQAGEPEAAARALDELPPPTPGIADFAPPAEDAGPVLDAQAQAVPVSRLHKAAVEPPAGQTAARALERLALGQAAEAEALLVPALAAEPEDAALRLLLARALHAQGRGAEALARLAERESDPADRDYHALRAALEQQLGRHGEAAARYGRLCAAFPDEATYWLGLGLALDGLNRTREARAAYARALQLNSLSEPARAHAASRLAAGD